MPYRTAAPKDRPFRYIYGAGGPESEPIGIVYGDISPEILAWQARNRAEQAKWTPEQWEKATPNPHKHDVHAAFVILGVIVALLYWLGAR